MKNKEEKKQWARTHFEIVTFFGKNHDKISKMMGDIANIWDAAFELTEWFEKIHSMGDFDTYADWYSELQIMFNLLLNYTSFEDFKNEYFH